MTHALMVYVTYPDQDRAQEISQEIVSAHLAACANIFAPHQSLYWWEGELQSGQEIAVIYKTTRDCFKSLKEKIIELHPFDCPCIVALDIADGYEAFIHWIKDSL